LEIATTLQAAYNEQYSGGASEWRAIGAKHKAANIVEVCRGHNFSKVLECGAGEGSVLQALADAKVFPELHAVEISDSGIAVINQRRIPSLVEVKKFDGYTLPFPDKSFDLVYCTHVLEHVEHPRLLLRELLRVARFQVLEVPLDYSIGCDKNIDHFLGYGHINVFTPTTFRFLIRSEGYRIHSEHLSYIADDVLRFYWYRNLKLEKTLRREAVFWVRPFRQWMSRLRQGRERQSEFDHQAYTCLAEGVGELKIF
jgi:ubiquinone/menaquinone biosynthesis C-methylase UbiE